MSYTMVCNSENKTNAMPSSKRRKAIVTGRQASVAEDIMTEVLLRLPIKSIVRFRAVCRSWAALLSSEEFCRLHRAITRVAGVPPKLLHFSPTALFEVMGAYSCSLTPGPKEEELMFTLDNARGKWVEVLTPASCHGLTLLYDSLTKAYYILNAATRAVKHLPPYTGAAAHWTSTGLGFDARTREYKMVRLINGMYRPRQLTKQETIGCEVYTPGGIHGDRWRPAAGGVPFGLRRFAASATCNAVERRLSPVFANRFLHWLIEPYLVFKRPRRAIVCFSIMEETFRCVRSPPFSAPPGLYLTLLPPQAPPVGHLVETDSQLCLVRDLRSNPHGSTLEIWRLLEYSSGDWSLDHRINLSGHVMGRELREPQTVRVIGCIDTGRSGKTIIITTCKHKVHEKFEKKVHTYDLSSLHLDTILSVIETSPSTNGYIPDKPPPPRFGLFEDCLAPMHKTDKQSVYIRLEPSPDYSLVTNLVVPWAVDPEDGKILLNTGRKIGVYDQVKQTVQNLYSLDEVPLVASEPHLGVCQGSHFTASSAGYNSTVFTDQPVGMDNEIFPLVPMLYEESLACYPRVGVARWLSFS